MSLHDGRMKAIVGITERLASDLPALARYFQKHLPDVNGDKFSVQIELFSGQASIALVDHLGDPVDWIPVKGGVEKAVGRIIDAAKKIARDANV